MDKKAQGLSLNTIIIAIIVLVVLVVIIMVFTGGIGGFTKGITTCDDKGNHKCLTSCSDEPGYVLDPAFKCKTEGNTCCIRIS